MVGMATFIVKRRRELWFAAKAIMQVPEGCAHSDRIERGPRSGACTLDHNVPGRVPRLSQRSIPRVRDPSLPRNRFVPLLLIRLSQLQPVDGFGHVSCRDPRAPTEHFLLSRNLAPALVAPADIVTWRIADAEFVCSLSFASRLIHADQSIRILLAVSLSAAFTVRSIGLSVQL